MNPERTVLVTAPSSGRLATFSPGAGEKAATGGVGKHSRLSTRRCLAFVCLLGFSLVGCASTSLLHFGGDNFPTPSNKDPVIRMVTLWDPGEGPGIDRKTSRGFVGQILFFTSKGKTPAKVNGALRAYVYDDEGTREQQIKPIHEFFLPPETLAAHLRKTDLGATYGLFVPYTKKGSHKVKCSVRVRYIPVDEATGQLNELAAVFSPMAHVTLPGPDREGADAASEKIVEAESPKTQILPVGAAVNERTSRPRPDAVPLDAEERERIMTELRGERGESTDDRFPDQARSHRLSLAQPSDSLPEAESSRDGHQAAPGRARSHLLNHPLANWEADEPQDEEEPSPSLAEEIPAEAIPPAVALEIRQPPDSPTEGPLPAMELLPVANAGDRTEILPPPVAAEPIAATEPPLAPQATTPEKPIAQEAAAAPAGISLAGRWSQFSAWLASLGLSMPTLMFLGGVFVLWRLLLIAISSFRKFVSFWRRVAQAMRQASPPAAVEG